MNRYAWILMALCVLTPSSGAADDAASAWVPTDMEGESHDVDELLAQGRNVTLIFWQTWCGPCKREAPGLALATALCVLGPEAALRLIEALPRTEALVVGMDGAVLVSSGRNGAIPDDD